jgi:CDP-glycerol glycerophosphotransferase (TagB/SpsB family)
LNSWRKIRPELVVFADAHHDSRPAAMELLVRAVREDGSFRVAEDYLDYGRCGEVRALLHSMAFMKLYAQAGTVVICDNFLPAAPCRKKPGTKIVQLWHACGWYKKFGYDAKDDIPEGYRGNVFRNTDLVTVSGKAAVEPFCSAMRLTEKQVKAVGVSRTDLYFDEKWRDGCREAFFRRYPQAAGKKVVLWAPTFRGNAGIPRGLDLDLHALQSALGSDYFLLSRLHPHMLSQMEADFPCSIPTERLYPLVDVLIADYSSLIYEYLLFGGGLVLYVPDLPEYRERRGFYMDPEQIPAEKVLKVEDLADAVKRAVLSVKQTRKSPGCSVDSNASNGLNASNGSNGLNGSNGSNVSSSCEWKEQLASPAVSRYRSFCEKYMDRCDGHATERICSWIAENAERSKTQPLA